MFDKFFEILGWIVAAVGGAGVIILGFSTWIGNIWANKLYEKERRKQEAYLKEIQNKFDLKMAELNSQLERNNLQFEILNKERIEVIKCLYLKLLDMQDFLGIYFRKLKNGEKQNIDIAEIKNLINSISDFMDYNNHNRIFFNEKICHSLNEIDAIITIIMNLYRCMIENNSIDEELEKEGLIQINLMITQEIPKFRNELELEFRKLIGVS